MKNPIQIQFVKIAVSESLTDYITNKLDVLFRKYPQLIKAQVYIKKETENRDKECVCEIELSLPGPRLFASSKEYNFEVSVKHTISELEHQLQKGKAKLLATH
ncbi:ribosome-associated translation inhibitor RaiA [Aquimarina sp. RZ0]|uniref:ribosome hibernation-promoting factor, HPF/YfiA family n=1 Tax=Aquimarina sp. RZ0 TaxID=2607730 RepID=UPI0011F36859|nr:ribosome-associated translation inhibitor RaiA [Aquimarina sp. RZ0]KAA1243319.1 ribosome-associated translation inhibitor RaiA [Aquimarina sp. RZ0]